MLLVVVNKDRVAAGYEMDPAKTVLDLKHAIYERTDTPVDEFRLRATINGRLVQLEDNRTLESYGLDEETLIRIVGNAGIQLEQPMSRIVALR